MRVMVFDTETTGLPQTKIINLDTLHLWPNIVQFSYILFDLSDNDIVRTKDYIVKLPKSISIPEDSTNIHGITNQMSSKKGEPIERLLKEFFYYLREVDLIIGHNINFDIDMVKVELLRIIHNQTVSNRELKRCKYDLHYLLYNTNIYCTLKQTVKFCNVRGINKLGYEYLKYPKLIELHEKLFNTIPNNLHNSLNDILVTLRCYVMFENNTDLNETCEKFKTIANRINLFG